MKDHDKESPIMNAEEVASYLGISRAGAYQLFNRADFPTLQIGKRRLVPRSKLLDWVDRHTEVAMIG